MQVDPQQLDQTEPDAPLPIADLVPETATNSSIRPRDRWMGVLTLAVIAVALFLGWMMGYVRRPRGPVGTKARTTVNATPQPVQTKPPEDSSLSASSAAHAPDQPTPASPATSPVPSAQSGSSPIESAVPPAGSLVVYENGKVIYRTPSPTSRRATKDAASGPVTVPSNVADEYLMLRVEPEYPETAREQHIQGPVVLDALVGKDGMVEKLSTVSGDSQLAAAATDAVRQWRFKPFLRNGSAEEFQTQITVSFRLP